MHILFDLRTIKVLSTADQIYLAAVVDSLLPALEEKDRITVILRQGTDLPFNKIEHPSVLYLISSPDARTRVGFRELCRIIRRMHPDIYWSADPLTRPPRRKRFGPKIIYSVPEILHLCDSRRFSLRERLQWHIFARSHLAAADALFTPNTTVANELRTRLIPDLRGIVHTVSNGIHPLFRTHTEDEITRVRTRYHIPQRYIIMFGRAIGNHNLATPLRALGGPDEVTSAACVIVGDNPPSPELRRLVRESHLEGMVHFFDFDELPPADFSAIISGATALAEPSVRPDFLPSVGAGTACGTPVICAATPWNRELFGDAVQRLHPTDASEWAKVITALTLSLDFRERCIVRGLAFAAKHTWTATVRQTFGFARELIAASPERF